MEKYESRFYPVLAVAILATLVLIFSAARLQVLDDRYSLKAESTTISKQATDPSRGLFLDRMGRRLVENETVYDLLVTHALVQPDIDTMALCNLLSIDRASFEERIDKDFSLPRYSRKVPFYFQTQLSAEQASILAEQMYRFDGFELTNRERRRYPYPYAAHILGYLNEASAEQVADEALDFSLGDYIGASGLEEWYDTPLRGSKGVSYIMKDNLGRKVESLREGALDTAAVAGKNLVTTLDIDLQAYGEDLMRGRRGAIVAIEPSTGEILASVTAPNFDPADLAVGQNRSKAFHQLSNDSLRPLLNRSIMARYPPGSLFKPILSLIALQEGVTDVRRRISCAGGYTHYQTTWNCHCGGGAHHLSNALARSCNTYYYVTYKELIERDGFRKPEVGLAILNSYLKKMGLGARLGVDIAGEQPGFLPTDAYYQKLYEEEGGRWYATYTISNGIGQGEIELTTLQMANLAAILANRGHYYQPHFMKNYDDASQVASYQSIDIGIDEIHFQPVIEGMYRSISWGTGVSAYIPGIDVCGKTGTSQNPHGDDHSVFFAFAPKENPKIAIAVYVENAGWGGSFAAPIASLMIERYLSGEVQPGRQWLEDRMMNRAITTAESVSVE